MKTLFFVLFLLVAFSCKKDDVCWKCVLSTVKYHEPVDSVSAHIPYYVPYTTETFCDKDSEWIRDFEAGRTQIGYSKCECELQSE